MNVAIACDWSIWMLHWYVTVHYECYDEIWLPSMNVTMAYDWSIWMFRWHVIGQYEYYDGMWLVNINGTMTYDWSMCMLWRHWPLSLQFTMSKAKFWNLIRRHKYLSTITNETERDINLTINEYLEGVFGLIKLV
jgi:hypothetical protein